MRMRMIDTLGDGRRRFLLALETGDEAIATITDFAREVGLAGGSLSAIGAFSKARLGWFNSETREFVENHVDEQAEVIAFSGNVALEGGKPKLHVHVGLALRDATTRGGHLVAGWARPTLEVIVEESPTHLCRAHDPKSGLVLLQP